MSAGRTLLGCLALCAAPPLSSAAEAAPAPREGWQQLAPLPDPIGYGGMFAGVLGGRLIAGGGSQFRDKPNWLQGAKAFSDRIFVLARPEGRWAEDALKLPKGAGHFASAATADAIYFAGGVDATSCLRETYELRAEGGKLTLRPLPALPLPLGYAAAAILGSRLYVAGGIPTPTSKEPSTQVWSLDLARSAAAEHPAWRREPDLPAPGVFVAAAAAAGDHLYVLGGIGFTPAPASTATPSARAYRLAPGARAWERLPDLPGPRVGPASPCPVVAGQLFVIGGYAEVFPGAPREHPGFSRQTLLYSPAKNAWRDGPVLPHAPVPDRDMPGDAGPAPMLAAPAVVWAERVVVISGEVRASVRSPAVLAFPLARLQP